EQSDREPDRHADQIADKQASHGHFHGLEKTSVERRAPEVLADVCGRRQDHLRPASARYGEPPEGDDDAEEQHDAGDALHLVQPPCPDCLSAVAISAASSASFGLLMSRGRGSGTLNSRTMRPGRGDISSTRSPRQAASRTSWVTNTMVLPRLVQMRWISP